MAPAFSLVKDIDRNNKKALKLRVVRLFTRTGGYEKNNAMEIVFHDNEGGRITGIIKKINIPLFEHRLVQGRVYGKYQTTVAQFRIVFHAKTLLLQVPEESFFPDFMFDLRDFGSLANVGKIDETLLFDVIGKVCEIHNPEEKEISGKRVRMIEMIIEDAARRRISCTLWGDYVDQILGFESNMTAEPPVIILQLCRAKVYQYKVTLSNSFEVTQIHTQNTISAIQKFISTLPKSSAEGGKSVSRGSVSLSRLEVDDLAASRAIFHPVDHLFVVDEESTFWICAIISSFVDDWWYLACAKCHKKLVENDEDYDCTVCKKSYASGIYRYKIRLEVLDSTADASVLCWDREAEKLIGRSCHELRIEFLENRDESVDLPEELVKLIDQIALFKVTVKDGQIHNESSAFTVSRIVTDPTLVKMYNKWTIEDENEENFMTLLQGELDNIVDGNSEDEVTTPIKKIEPVRMAEDSSTAKKLVFDEGMDSNSSRKSRVLTKNGKPVRLTTQEEVFETDNEVITTAEAGVQEEDAE